jgi:hypothetical protein
VALGGARAPHNNSQAATQRERAANPFARKHRPRTLL